MSVDCLLVLPRTRSVDAISGAVTYGNLYSELLDYVIFAVLIFYVLTIGGLFRLRRPNRTPSGLIAPLAIPWCRPFTWLPPP